MRLIPAALLVLVTFSRSALACLSAPDPSFDSMIKEATLIVRGQVVRETGNDRKDSQGLIQRSSDVLVERVYRGAALGVLTVRWKDYSQTLCPRPRLNKGDYGFFFLSGSGSEFVLVDEQFGKLAVSRSQAFSQDLDPILAIERDLKWAVQNDSGGQRVEDVLLLGRMRRPMDTAELRALLPTKDALLESAVHLSLLKLRDYSKLEAAGRLASGREVEILKMRALNGI